MKLKNMSNIYNLGRILKTECNLLHLTRNCRIKNLDNFEGDEADMRLWRARLLNVKDKGMAVCCYHKQLFGNVFERRES